MEDARREKEWKRAEEKGNALIQRTPFVGNINSEVCSPRHFLSLQTKEEVYHDIPSTLKGHLTLQKARH